MDFAPEGPMALPLWINGHAYLTVTDGFFDVVNPDTGEAIRRTPLCGEREVAEATQWAQQAALTWAATVPADRQRCLAQLGQLLDQYTGHFARLIREEGGGSNEAAVAQVEAAVAALAGAAVIPGGGVAALIADATQAFGAVVAELAARIRAGSTVLLKPSPKAPGALFALAELSARAGLPAGVLSVVHGDTAVIQAICAESRISTVCVRGEPAFVAQLKRMSERCHRVLH